MSVQAISASAQTQSPAQAQDVQHTSAQQGVSSHERLQPEISGEATRISEEAIQEQIDDLNKILTDKNTNISLEYDKLNSPKAINIVDSTSGKIIRSIPPESAIEIANKARDYVVGLIVDEYA